MWVEAHRWLMRQATDRIMEAEFRLDVIRHYFALRQDGRNKTAAVVDAAAHFGVGIRTVWSWLHLLRGQHPHDYLPALCPRATPRVLHLSSKYIIKMGISSHAR